jgi:hypothetical protein
MKQEEPMREFMRLSFVALIWVVNGGTITVIYTSQFLFHMPTYALLLVSVMIIGASVAATWLLTRYPTEMR